MVWALTTYESEVSFFKVFQSPALTCYSSCESGGSVIKTFCFLGLYKDFCVKLYKELFYFVSVVSGCKSSLPKTEELTFFYDGDLGVFQSLILLLMWGLKKQNTKF